MRIPSGTIDQPIYFVAVDATDLVTREIGLSAFTVYRSRNGGAAIAFTTPTVAEIDDTNMPGVYALLLDEDMAIDADDDSQEVALHITHAGMAPVTLTYELYRPKITAGQTVTAAGGRVSADVTAISGDATAAENLEKAYDGRGYGPVLFGSTVATTPTATTLTLSDVSGGSSDLFVGATAVIRDDADPSRVKWVVITDYDAGTDVFTYVHSGGLSFTTAAGDTIEFLTPGVLEKDRATLLGGYNNVLEVGSGLPYATITAAQTAAVAGDLIVVHRGTYNEANLGKNDVTYFLNEGALIAYSGAAAPIFKASAAVTQFTVAGRGRIANASGAAAVFADTAGSEIHVRCSMISGAPVVQVAEGSCEIIVEADLSATSATKLASCTGIDSTIVIDAPYMNALELGDVNTVDSLIELRNGRFIMRGETPVSGTAGTIRLVNLHAKADAGAGGNGLNAPTGVVLLLESGSLQQAEAGRPSLSGAGPIYVGESFAYDSASVTASSLIATRGESIKAKTDQLGFTASGNVESSFEEQAEALLLEAELSEESVTDLVAGVVADVSMAAMIATVGRIDRSSKTVIQGTVGAGSTQTQIVVSTIDPLLTVANQLKGLVMKFAKDTTTPALRGQGTEITGNSVGGPIIVLTLTTAPVSGDEFCIE